MAKVESSTRSTDLPSSSKSKESTERETSSIVCCNHTRTFILIVSLLCLTLSQMNALTFNFTVICMTDLVEEFNSTNQIGSHWMESSTHKSLLFAGLAVGAVIGLIPSVPLISKLGVKNFLTVTGFVSAISTILFPLSVSLNFYAVLLCRVFQGFGICILFTAVGVIPSVWAPTSEMGTFLAILSCAFQFSNIICMPVSGILCDSPLGWRSIYYIFGAATFVSYIIFGIFYSDSPKTHKNVSDDELDRIQEGKKGHGTREPVPYKAICTDPCVIVAWLSVFGGNLGFTILVFYGPTYLREVLHFDVKGTGFASALPFILSALVKFIAGQVSDRLYFLSEKTRFTFCAAVSQIGLAASFVVMAYADNRTLAQAAYTFAITASGLNIMGTIKCIQIRCGHHMHFAVAVISFKAYAIQFGAPILVGLLCPDNTPEEWSRLFIISAIIVILFNAPFPFFTSSDPGDYVHRKTEKEDIEEPEFIEC